MIFFLGEKKVVNLSSLNFNSLFRLIVTKSVSPRLKQNLCSVDTEHTVHRILFNRKQFHLGMLPYDDANQKRVNTSMSLKFIQC